MPSSWSEHGFKWGFGFAIALRVVDDLLGPRVVKHKTVESSPRPPGALVLNKSSIAIGEDCDGQSKALLDCLDSSNVSDISKCQCYLDMLKKCRTDSKSTSSA